MPRITLLISAFSAIDASLYVIQVCNLRTSLCQITIFKAGASIYGLIPKLSNLVMASVDVFVWTVANTKCHVRAALKAISAVSADLISQTIIISGS